MAESEHNVTININGNASGAVGALGKVKSALNSIGSTIGLVTRAFGLIGLAINGINALVTGFKWLNAKMTELARAAAKLNFDRAMASAATETKRLCSFHEKLNKLLKDELDTLSKQNALEKVEKQGKKDYADGQRAADRARQIYEASTPEEEQKLRDKFAEEDVQLSRKAKKDEREEEIKALDKEETVYQAGAEGAKNKIGETKKQIDEETFNLKRANGNKDEKAKIQKRIDDLNAALKNYEKLFEEMTKKASFNREMIKRLQSVKDYAGESAESIQKKQEEKTKARESEKDDRDWKERRQREADKKSTDEAVAAEESKSNKRAILDAQAENAQNKANNLRAQYEELRTRRAPGDYEKLSDLRAKIDSYEQEAESYTKQSKEIEKDERTSKISYLESYAERLSNVEGVSQNRLTAMGLGSGVSGNSGVASDVRRLVDLLKQNVDATKSIHLESSDSVGIYGD